MLCPNIALLQSQIEEIVAQIKLAESNSNWDWFTKRGINVHDKDDYYILNKMNKSEYNHWNRLCNGTVLNRTGKLFSLPIIRLYNLDSKECCISYKNSDLVQKIGGDMICVFWPTRQKEIRVFHNETEISTFDNDMEIFRPYRKLLTGLQYQDFDTGYCYTFQIDKDEIYLVGGRHVTSMWEFTEEELDYIAKQLKAKRPVRLRCNSWHMIKDILAEHGGIFIIRDRITGERANTYIKIGRPKQLEKGRYKRLVPYWLSDEHQHIIAQFPETKTKYIIIDQKVLKLRSQIRQWASSWLALQLTRDGLVKSLKTSSVPKWAHKIIMRLQEFHHDRWDELIMDLIKKMQSKQIIEILELKD